MRQLETRRPSQTSNWRRRSVLSTSPTPGHTRARTPTPCCPTPAMNKCRSCSWCDKHTSLRSPSSTLRGGMRATGPFIERPAPWEALRTALQRWLPTASMSAAAAPRGHAHRDSPRRKKALEFSQFRLWVDHNSVVQPALHRPSGRWESCMTSTQEACAVGSTSHCFAALAPHRTHRRCRPQAGVHAATLNRAPPWNFGNSGADL